MQLSFIFPVHNEEDHLLSQIRTFIKLISVQSASFEIILIENGSTDNSWKIIKKLERDFSCIKSLFLPQASYGMAIRLGILNSVGAKIFILNVDYYDFDFIVRSSKLLNNLDLVIGSKTLSSSQDKRSSHRRLGTYFFNVFLRLALNYPGTDTHGIKAFRRSAKLLNLVKTCRTQNELFDTELVLKLTKGGALFVDLPQKVVEIRKSRYLGMRRFFSTTADLISIIKTKYFSRNVFLTNLVDADDYGFSKQVNQAIISGVANQSIDVVSIVANLVSKKDVNNLLKIAVKPIFSLHFNLLRGKPVSSPKTVASLINRNGYFYNFPIFVLRMMLGLIVFREIELELLAQYRRLVALGIKATCLSSEQHLHIFSPINSFIRSSLKATEIRKIRSQASSYHSLNGKYFRKSVLFIIKALTDLRFGKEIETNQIYHAYIVHPGA